MTLDEWTREQVTAMRKMGNIRSNEIYNPDPSRHPPPTVTDIDERDSELAKFIRRKYELGAFKAHAAKELATSNAVTSRAQALDARNGHESRAPLRPEELPRRERDLPSLPATAGRRTRPTNNAPLWSGLAPQGTGASNTSNTSAGSTGSLGGRPVFPPRTSSSPAFSTSSGTSTAAALLRPPQPQQPQQQTPAQPRADLLVDIGGSSSSTRPLQLNGFPTVPAFQPPSATPNAAAPVMSPGGLISPLALGQQAFFPSPPIASANPFAAMGQQVSTPPQMGGGSYFQPMPHHQLATSPGGMGMMPTGMGSMGSMGSMGMGMGMNGMGASSSMGSMAMGVGMPGAMGGGMSMGSMGVPVQVQGGSYQPHPWGSYGA